MKILITGATGLIGKVITNLAIEHGHEVHYVTTSKSKIKITENLKGFYWNPAAGTIDENCIVGVEKVIHLAGASISNKWTKDYKQEIIESRTLSTNLLFNLIKTKPNKVNQIVSASAIGIYPNSETIEYHENETKVDPGFLGHVVEKWEASVDAFKLLPVSICKIRIGLVLSAQGGALVEMVKPAKLGFGAAFGTGKQMQSWIHVNDLAHLFMTATEKNWSGVYNGVAPKPVTNAVLAKAISAVLEKPFFLPNIPRFVMKIALGEMHELLYNSQLVSAEKVLSTGFQFQFETLKPALEDLLV
jgi:uncharacterized protein